MTIRFRLIATLLLSLPICNGQSTTYYFPHLAFAGGWQTTLTYVNYSPQTVSCQTAFYGDSGSPLAVPFGGTPVSTRTDSLAPGGSLHQQTQASVTGSATTGWAQAQCSGPIKASLLYRLYDQNNAALSEAGVNAMTSSTTEFVTFAQTATGIAYANPSTAPVLVTIAALDSGGLTLSSTQQTLEPKAHSAFNVGPLLGLSNFTGSIQITSTSPIVSLSLNAEAFPVVSSLPPGDLPAATPLAPTSAMHNVANVTGSVDALYPTASSSISASVLLLAATFNAAFDIVQNAKPFSVVVTTDAADAIVNIDPVHGTWQATLPVPSQIARIGDFSASEFTPVLDFLTCTANGCSPFPNNLIPISRFDPAAVQAQQLLPLPNSQPSSSANGLFIASGTLTGPHVDIGSLLATNFGAFFQISPGSPLNRTASLRLYVDGALIASKDTSYSIQ